MVRSTQEYRKIIEFVRTLGKDNIPFQQYPIKYPTAFSLKRALSDGMLWCLVLNGVFPDIGGLDNVRSMRNEKDMQRFIHLYQTNPRNYTNNFVIFLTGLEKHFKRKVTVTLKDLTGFNEDKVVDLLNMLGQIYYKEQEKKKQLIQETILCSKSSELSELENKETTLLGNPDHTMLVKYPLIPKIVEMLNYLDNSTQTNLVSSLHLNEEDRPVDFLLDKLNTKCMEVVNMVNLLYKEQNTWNDIPK